MSHFWENFDFYGLIFRIMGEKKQNLSGQISGADLGQKDEELHNSVVGNFCMNCAIKYSYSLG